MFPYGLIICTYIILTLLSITCVPGVSRELQDDGVILPFANDGSNDEVRSLRVEVEGDNDTENSESYSDPDPDPNNSSNLDGRTRKTVLMIKMMEECDPNDENQECENFPHARCLEQTHKHSITTSHICKCDYLHTVFLQGNKTQCFINVFAPCTYGDTEYSCGENMECREDSLGISEGKFCRCLSGFAAVENEHGIPAYCRPIVSGEIPDKEDQQISSGSEQFLAMINTLGYLLGFLVLSQSDCVG
ncbi:unnamed protein product [Allacma fusca]|uniref:EGF-like domain-containing protein n=1 Tax=Allacma fusca TaxID=39272 RepID=A0A8J2KA47_9HEXA|nr:unnamed protein product [Allacma fusca]